MKYEFLERIYQQSEQRISKEAGGRHPLVGLTPQTGGVMLRSNDYLCLSRDPRIIEAEVAALRTMGHGDVSARLWSSLSNGCFRGFEQKLAGVMEAEDAILFPSGFTANMGLLQALAEPKAPFYFDLMAHASFRLGAMLADISPFSFRHNRSRHLAGLIERHGPGFIVVDALYSTDGALCPLHELVDVAERYGCVLIVDETHSLGTHGTAGGGLCQAGGIASRVHFRTMGLSKAVPCRGGAIVCSPRGTACIRDRAYPLIFSTSVMPHELAAYNAALDIFTTDGWRRDALQANHGYLRAGLDSLGYNVGTCDSQIISLEPGELMLAMRTQDALERRGVFGAIFFPPATSVNRCSIRLSLNSGLTRAQLDRVLDACRDMREEVDIKHWRSTRRRRNTKA